MTNHSIINKPPRERERERERESKTRQVLLLKLRNLLITVITVLMTAIIVSAFTGPGSNQPPTGDPIFWRLNSTNMYYNAGNVGIGTTGPGQKLTVAGTIESTTGGFKFPDGTIQTAAGGKASNAFAAFTTNNQTISAATQTKVQFDSEQFDDGGNYNPTTYRYTCPSAGKYLISFNMTFFSVTATRAIDGILYKNGGMYRFASGHIAPQEGNNTHTEVSFSQILDCATSDYFEVYAYSPSQTFYIYGAASAFSGVKLY